MLIALLQNNTDETTGGIKAAANKAGDAAKNAGKDTFDIFKGINDFFAATFKYLTGQEFVSNVIASVVVVLLGIFAYRVLTHGVPRVLRWRRGRRDVLDAET